MKIIYIDYNFIDKRYPNSPNDGVSFYTYGFGSIYARKFKKYNPEFVVECWKADSRINQIFEKEIEDVKHKIFPSKKFGKLGHFSTKLLKHLKNETKKNHYLIINISSIRHLLFYAVILFLKKVIFVVQHHGEASAIYKAKINKIPKKLFYTLQIPLERMAFKKIDLFFVLDKGIKNYLPKNNRIIIEVSTTGVDEGIFFPIDKHQAKKQLGWDESKKHIIYIGRLNYTKRPDILIDIYNEFKEEGRTDIELVLAGHEIYDPLYEKAKKSGALLYGIIPQRNLYIYLSAADIYVLPRLTEEHRFGGIGMLPIQALLCNTPVVSSTLKNFPLKDRDKVGIYAFDHQTLRYALNRILNKEIEFSGIRDIALNYYSWEKISKKTAERYLFLLKRYTYE